MNAATLRTARLFSQQLIGGQARTPAQVVHRLGAIQAQDYAAALWAIGARAAGRTMSDVEQSVVDRQIVRSWPMRGTLHFVAAADLRWMLALLAPRIMARTEPRLRQLGLTKADIEHCAQLFSRELAGAPPAARDELYALMAGNEVAPDGQRGIHVLLRLCQTGLLCQGPVRGRQATFTLLEEWLPPAPPLSEDDARAELARRYFTGHGPATVRDFAWWSGLTLTAARSGLEAVAEGLAAVEFDGATHYCDPAALAGPTSSAVQLLPGFDEYLLGYQDRVLVLPGHHAGRIVPGGNGIFRPMILDRGQVVGTWRRIVDTRIVRIELEPFTTLSARARTGAAAAARRYGRFLGRPVVL